MRVPQMIFIALQALTIGFHMAKHGEQRSDYYDGVIQLIACGFVCALLWWGGFFSNCN